MEQPAKRPKAVIYMHDGNISEIVMDTEIDIFVVDYHTDDADIEMEPLILLNGEEALVYPASVDEETVSPERVTKAFDDIETGFKINSLKKMF